MEKQNKKKLLFAGIRIVCFLAIFTLLLQAGSMYFMPAHGKAEDGTVSYITNGYRGETKNSLDMIAVGNSDLYRGLSPIELWNQYGIASYVCGEPLQKMWKAHRVLKDAFRYQKPKVVVLEVDSVFSNSNASFSKHKKKKPFLHTLQNLVHGFKNGMYNDGVGTGIGYVFPIVKYHSNWDKIGTEEFAGLEHGYHYLGKGFVLGTKTIPYTHGFDYMQPSDKIEQIDSVTERYMEKIVQLCEKNGAKLVLLELPSASSWSSAKHNSIQQFATKHGLSFYDLNLNAEKFGFDWMTDTKDGGNHLNVFGAEKASAYFGGFLKNTYGLPDRRTDPAYQHWREDAQRFEAKKQEQLLGASQKQGGSGKAQP